MASLVEKVAEKLKNPGKFSLVIKSGLNKELFNNNFRIVDINELN